MKRMIGLLAACMLALSIAQPTFADTERTFADESIYDLLVDRFNNGIGTNDMDVNAQDPSAFNGGDFAGISNRMQHLIDMHFTMISMGPVFKTATYDGNEVLDYNELEPHFGTSEEFIALIKELHANDMKAMADFPFTGEINDTAVQNELMESAVQFVSDYDLDGLRLTKITNVDTDFLNKMIEAVKEANEGIYVITNEQSDASFDSMPAVEQSDAIQESFVQVDPETSSLDLFSNDDAGKLLQFDDLTGPRYTYKMVELRQFPPTRWKVATAAQFMLPGVPLVPYATEIAVNGEKAPESHPFFNFKTDMELHEWIGDLNTLRNDSEALRNGDFKMLHNEDGFVVFERSNEDEMWIVALNTTSEVQSLEVDPELIGESKKLRGVLGQDLIKETKDDKYHVVLDRETAEIYIVEQDKGFNTPYLIASILVVVLFLGFLFLVIRKGKQSRPEEPISKVK